MRIRALKAKITSLLQAADLNEALQEIRTLDQSRLINPLISCLCSCDELVKWHAVTAIGQVVAAMAAQDFESARIVMRRFMWMLNDESGGIGWGVPESIGEVCAVHTKISQEYAHILVSFMREDGFYLELPELQRGLMWGLGRLAQVDPQLLREKNALAYLSPYLFSDDLHVKAGAAYASGLLEAKQSKAELKGMAEDDRLCTLYINHQFVEMPLGNIAIEALSRLQ